MGLYGYHARRGRLQDTNDLEGIFFRFIGREHSQYRYAEEAA